MKNEKELRKQLNLLIKEFKGEIRENSADIKRAYLDTRPDAGLWHLKSVNGALEYVIDRLNSTLK